VANPEILKGKSGGRQCINPGVGLYFIANAHNELYAFYIGKCGLLKNNYEPIGVAPFESETAVLRSAYSLNKRNSMNFLLYVQWKKR